MLEVDRVAVGSPSGRPWVGRARQARAVVAAAVVLLVFPYVVTGAYDSFVAVAALLNAVFAVSLVPMVDAGRVSILQGSVVGVGGYTVAILTIEHGWPLWPAIAAGGLLAVVVMLPVGLVALRLSGLFFSIATIGFAAVMSLVLSNWISVTGGESGLTGVPAFGSSLTSIRAEYYVVLALLAAVLLGVHRFRRSRTGWGVRSLGEDEVLARAAGVAPVRHRITAYVLSSFVGGIAGGFFATVYQGVAPSEFNTLESILILAMVVIGGSGLVGAVLGGLFIVWATDSVQSLGQYSNLIQALIFLAAVYFLPDGLRSLPSVLRAAFARLAGPRSAGTVVVAAHARGQARPGEAVASSGLDLDSSR